MAISPTTLEFLRALRENNTREWFANNRKTYETVKQGFEEFVGELLNEVGKFDDVTGLTPKHCIFRINRDIRFSKDKSPYKSCISAAISRGGRQSQYLDYYLHIQPGESFLGGGAYAPTGPQLAKIRQEIDYNVDELNAIMMNPEFVAYFGAIQGTKLKTTPKGYDREHPHIELLKLQQFFFMHSYTDAEVLSPDFLQKVAEGCRILKPLLDFLNYILFDEEPTEKL